MSCTYRNRLVITGPAPAIDAVEAAFRQHDAARQGGAKGGLLSKAFGPIAFARQPVTPRHETALVDLLLAAEEDGETGFVRVYPEVIRVHFDTNGLQCHKEVKRLARLFPEVLFRLDWMSEEDRTGRLLVQGPEVFGEADLPCWSESLYVLSDPYNLSGSREDFSSLGNTDFFQPIDRGE